MQPPHVRPDFDLQSHSVHSDGALSAADVVAHAAAAGLRTMALTDHDTVDGVGEALAAAREHGLRCSPAAELSSVSGEFEDLHVCGYELRHDDPVLLRHARRLPRRPRPPHLGDGRPAGGARLPARPHGPARPRGRRPAARAARTSPTRCSRTRRNAARLRDEGIAGKNELFPPYLVPGAIAYVARSRPTVEEAIEVIHAAGGLAVWAHPFWDIDRPRRPCSRPSTASPTAGLDGVEVFYPTHDEAQTTLLYETCTSKGLLTTGSADFHGPEHGKFSVFGGFELYGLEPVLGPLR